MRFPLAACALLAACGVSADPGLDAKLVLAGAQFVPGPLPGDGGGPRVIAMNLLRFQITPGSAAQPLFGTLDAPATAAAFALEGDRGYWILVAGVPDTDTPTLPSFRTEMSFSRALAPGPVGLVGRAVDTSGRFGPAFRLPLTVAATAPLAGALVVTLSWSGPADLDLHVLDPRGTEIWTGRKQADGGALDFDSNSQCVEDGRDQEDVVFASVAPPGHYVVRVDAFSLCGAASASWALSAYTPVASLGDASGIAVDADTIGPHGVGTGRLALELDVP